MADIKKNFENIYYTLHVYDKNTSIKKTEMVRNIRHNNRSYDKIVVLWKINKYIYI